MKKTHKLYPVSYLSSDGQTTIHTCWNTKPSGKECWVGEAIEVVADHPDTLGDDYRAAAIAELEQRIATLKGVEA